MNIWKNSLPFLCLLVVSQAFGQNSLLWEVSGDGIETSYVFGTIHINDARVKSFDERFYAKLDSCDILTGEIVMDSVDMGKMMANMSKMMLPSRTTLRSLYDNEEHYLKVTHTVDSMLGSMGFALKMMKPFYISGALGVSALESKESSGSALDVYLQDYAKKKGLKLDQLESFESQLSAVDKISLDEQAEMLYQTVLELVVLDSLDAEDEFVMTYLSQNLDSISVYFEDVEGDSDFMKHLIENRNVEMVERIMQLSKDKQVFHTFGAGHLAGEKGVLELLRGKGLKVEPVTYSYNY